MWENLGNFVNFSGINLKSYVVNHYLVLFYNYFGLGFGLNLQKLASASRFWPRLTTLHSSSRSMLQSLSVSCRSCSKRQSVYFRVVRGQSHKWIYGSNEWRQRIAFRETKHVFGSCLFIKSESVYGDARKWYIQYTNFSPLQAHIKGVSCCTEALLMLHSGMHQKRIREI